MKVDSNPCLKVCVEGLETLGTALCSHPTSLPPVLSAGSQTNPAFPEPLRKCYTELNKCQCWFI